MESRKRLVRDVTSSETSLRPVKKRRVNVGENGSQGLVVASKTIEVGTIMKDSKNATPSHDPGSQMGTPGVPELAKPSVITPLNSFHELQRVSEMYEASTTPLRLEQAKTTAEDSSEGSRETPVFQLSVEANEDLVAPLHTVVLRDCPRRVSMADLCEANPSVAFLQTCIEKQESPSQSVSPIMEKSKQHNVPVWGPKALIMIFALFVLAHFLFTPTVLIEDPGSIYVPGGGFSGFWFTLGNERRFEVCI